MRSIAKLLFAAAALGAVALPLTAAEAMPAAQPLPLAEGTPHVTLTSGGCGPFAHRGFYGACRPNGGFGYGYGWRRGWHRPWGWHRHWRHW